MPSSLAALVRFLVRHRRWPKGIGILVPLAVLVAAPQLGSGFYTSLALNVLVFALVAMSLDLLGGYAGLISMGQAAFFGLGAYGIAYGEAHGHGPWASIGIAMLAVVVVGAVFGLVSIRTGGVTFIILTLALGQLIWGLAYRWVSVSGGDNGLPIIERLSLGPLDLRSDTTYYYFVVVVFCVCSLLLWLITRSPFGLSLRGIQDNEPRMRTLGYNVAVHKFVVFVIASAFAGVAGILNSFYVLYIGPSTLDFMHNGFIILMAVVGGLGTLWGGFVGAVVIVLMQQWMSLYIERWMTFMGLLFVFVVLFARAGLYGSLLLGVRWLASRAGAPFDDLGSMHKGPLSREAVASPASPGTADPRAL